MAKSKKGSGVKITRKASKSGKGFKVDKGSKAVTHKKGGQDTTDSSGPRPKK